MRAFYRCPIDVVLPADVLLLSETDDDRYVLSAVDPHPALEAAGAVRLGARLSEIHDADLLQVAAFDVERPVRDDEGDEATVAIRVAATDVDDDDVVLPGFHPRVVFAGDDPESYR